MIIGISGKIGSGKDTVGKIIQYLTAKDIGLSFKEEMLLDDYPIKGYLQTDWKIKKFSDKLKDLVCILIGCTREQLEDHKFKDTELGKEWEVFYWSNYRFRTKKNLLGRISKLYTTKQDALENKELKYISDKSTVESYILTPRLLLQLMGTECGRNIIHPNIWVNTLMNEYKAINIKEAGNAYLSKNKDIELNYPNFIVTDVRFKNEAEAIIRRSGLLIRVNRDTKNPLIDNDTHAVTDWQHSSETDLDSNTFDYYIDNNDSIENLIEQVKVILQKEKII